MFCPGACNWLYLSLTFKKLIFIICSIILFKLYHIRYSSQFLFVQRFPQQRLSSWFYLGCFVRTNAHFLSSWNFKVFLGMIYCLHFLGIFLHLVEHILKGVSNKKVGESSILWVLMSVNFNSWVRKIRWRRDRLPTLVFLGFPCGLAGKESDCNAGDLGSTPGLGRSPEEGKGYPLQYSGLANSMDCIVHVIAKSQTQLSDFHFISLKIF